MEVWYRLLTTQHPSSDVHLFLSMYMTNSDVQYVLLTCSQLNFDPEDLTHFLSETVTLF